MCFDFCLRVIWLLVLLNIIHLTNFSLNFLTQSHLYEYDTKGLTWLWFHPLQLILDESTQCYLWFSGFGHCWCFLFHMVGPPGFDIMFHILRFWRDLPQAPSQAAHDCYLCSKRVNFTGSLHDSWQYEFECQRDGAYFNVHGQKHAFMKILEN